MNDPPLTVTAARRPARLARAPWLTAAALLAACAPLIVLSWPLGPVVVSLTGTHGVHAGDALSLACAALAGLSLRRGLR